MGKNVSVASPRQRYKFGKIKEIPASSFTMNPVELYQYLPKKVDFKIGRLYWLDGIKGSRETSGHAHTDEDSFFIIIEGNAVILLDDNGYGMSSHPLSKNSTVWVPRLVWHKIERMSKDCILLDFVTKERYDPERKGYIEDYEKFKTCLAKRK